MFSLSGPQHLRLIAAVLVLLLAGLAPAEEGVGPSPDWVGAWQLISDHTAVGPRDLDSVERVDHPYRLIISTIDGDRLVGTEVSHGCEAGNYRWNMVGEPFSPPLVLTNLIWLDATTYEANFRVTMSDEKGFAGTVSGALEEDILILSLDYDALRYNPIDDAMIKGGHFRLKRRLRRLP